MVTGCREFPNSKRAGRNASEPRCSLVNELEKSTLWSDGLMREGRLEPALHSTIYVLYV